MKNIYPGDLISFYFDNYAVLNDRRLKGNNLGELLKGEACCVVAVDEVYVCTYNLFIITAKFMGWVLSVTKRDVKVLVSAENYDRNRSR